MKGVFLCIAILLCSLCVKSQGEFDYYISNTGSDANAGNSKLTPKKTIAGVAATVANGSIGGRPLSIGFKSGDVFNETFNPGFPIHAATYFENGSSKNFAILNGTEVFDNGWVRTGTAANLYEQSVTLSGYTGYGINNVGQYSIVSVFEIDRVLERTAPFTARKLLKFLNNMQAADATPGSFYEPVTVNVNPIKIYIHTSDGSSPNNNARYRYEITVRDRAFNSTYQQNNVFERLWIRGYGAGNGMIPAGANTSFNRMIFGPAAGIHHLGLRGATISNSLFLPSALNTDFYAVVFYDVEGYKRHNLIKNSIFLDVRYPLYTHNSLGSNFAALELDNVIAIGDTSEVESFVESSNTDSVIFNDVYSSGHKIGYGFGHAPYFSAKNSSFIDVVRGIGFGVENRTGIINNCFIRTRGNTRCLGIVMADTTHLLLANSIIHIKNYKHSPDPDFMGVFVEGAGTRLNRINAQGNIFVCDVDPTKYVLGASAANPASSNAAGSRWQNNVYILLRGTKIEWRIFKDYNTPGSRDILVNFENWKLKTGNDTRSLFFDLRNDPRGLKAIFVDPDNGDYSLANTFEANKIRELRAGMVSPISCFLQKPSYEEAARIIMNDGVLSANACRSPCVQNNIRINHMFEASLLSARKIQLQWNMEDERNIDHYEIVRSFGNSDFTNIAYVPANGLANYSYTDSNVMAGITYRYSVVVVTKLIDKCYSEVRSVKLEDGKPVTIYPNPSAGIIKLALNNYTGPVKVSVTNVLGIKVYSKELNSFYGMPLEVDLSSQSKGFYWIKVQTDKDNPIQSFILR